MRRLQLDSQRQNALLALRVAERTRDLDVARSELLDRLALAAEYRDDETQEHARRIGRTSGQIAERLGLPREMCELMVRAAPLHDVGQDRDPRFDPPQADAADARRSSRS